MKTSLIPLVASGLLAAWPCPVRSQSTAPQTTPVSNNPPVFIEPTNPSATSLERAVALQEETLNRLFGMGVHYGGVIPMAVETKRPFQLINPLAPAHYGDGLKNISVNPKTGRVEGIDIFAIHF